MFCISRPREAFIDDDVEEETNQANHQQQQPLIDGMQNVTF
jgi:hypothetical protein